MNAHIRFAVEVEIFLVFTSLVQDMSITWWKDTNISQSKFFFLLMCRENSKSNRYSNVSVSKIYIDYEETCLFPYNQYNLILIFKYIRRPGSMIQQYIRFILYAWQCSYIYTNRTWNTTPYFMFCYIYVISLYLQKNINL